MNSICDEVKVSVIVEVEIVVRKENEVMNKKNKKKKPCMIEEETT